MSVDEGLLAWIEECLGGISPGHPSDARGVTMRRMMGGATLYLDGTVFAIMDEGEIWFKADAETDSMWDEAGCARFTYTFEDGRSGTMNYRRAPADVYDDADEMRRWAKPAQEAGLRGAAKKKPRKRSKPR